MGYTTTIMNEGIKAGWAVLEEILKVTTIYRLSRDLGISETQIRNWRRHVHAPSMENFHRLQSYRLFAQNRERVTKQFSRFEG